MEYIGIVGRALRPAPRPVQADGVVRLERFIGRLEAAPQERFPAMHAAWHAFLNGVDRVIFSAVGGDETDADWVAALKRLFTSDPIGVVVAPGGPSGPLAQAFCDLPFTRTACLWVDSDPGLALDERVRVASQVVPTVPPGSRTPSPLPATALIGPLHGGACQALKGQHSAPTGPGALLTINARGRIRLAETLDPPGTHLPPRPAPQVSAVQFRIDRAIARMVEPINLTTTESPGLYRRLEREATAILEAFLRRGEITEFTVRCNEETSEGAGGPVIEVQIREPQRVESVLLKFHQMGF